MRKASLLAALAVMAAAGCDERDRGGPRAAPLAPFAESAPAVTRAGLEEHLRALQRIAERHRGTRAAGTPGYAASAAYVAARLREAGFEVRFQPVRFPFFRERSARLRAGGRRLRRNRDFRVLTYSGSGRVAGRVRAAGLGCARGDFDGVRGAVSRWCAGAPASSGSRP